MAAQWYCLIGQQQYGPFSSEQIQQLVQQGRLQREHSLRTETDSQWTVAGDLPGLFPPSQAPSNSPPAPSAPSVTPPRKRKRVVPPAPPAAATRPPAPAGGAVPQARPVTPPATAVPAAVPLAAAPLAAAPAGTPIAGRPAVATPVAAGPVASAPAAAAVPVAAAPVAAAVRAAGKPVAAARPVPLAPVVPPAAPPAPSREEGGAAHKRRGSRQKSQMLVGGLTAALLLLIVIAVVVMNRSPGKKSSEKSGRATASARGTAPEPSSNPEVDPTAAIIPAGREPGTIADPPQAASGAPAESAAAPKPNPLPTIGKWLDATRTRAGGLRGIVAIGVGKAWLDKVAGRPAVLNVEVQLTNRSFDETLEFTGWRPDNQPQSESQAMMVDDAGTLLRAVPLRPASGRRAARRRIHPEESATERLSFVFPDGESKYFRLALPYAALGQTGYLGFELPRQMIQEGDPDAKEKVRPEPAETEPETVLPAGATVKPRPGEPETIGDLRSEIERSGDPTTDGMKEPPKPAADEPPMPAEEPQKEPEKIPDIRKLIEQEDRKAEAKDKEQPGGFM